MFPHRGLFCLIPFLIPLAVLARPAKPPGAGAVLVPINTQFIGADGQTYTLSGTLTLQGAIVLPPPEPLAVTGLTVAPSSVLRGVPAVGTITLNRAPLEAVQVAVKADTLGLALAGPVTVEAGKTTATFLIGTAATANRDTWYTLTASYNATAARASLLVRAVLVQPPPAAGNPSMSSFLNGDGSPITGPLVYGQEVRIVGSAFGEVPGKVVWQGAALTEILAWSDTLIRVKLPVPVFKGGTQFDLWRPDGVWTSSLVPQDQPR